MLAFQNSARIEVAVICGLTKKSGTSLTRSRAEKCTTGKWPFLTARPARQWALGLQSA